MLVLAIDTSTPAVTAGVVAVTSSTAIETLATAVTIDPRAHAEVLTPHVLECLDTAGITARELSAVVVGVGPGPYTGLRVGMATAAAFGDALGIPVYGVCSLDAIAAGVATDSNLLVVTDARRREIYWARYENGVRVDGPSVQAPAEVSAAPSIVIAGSAPHAQLFDLPAESLESPTPAGLVTVAAPEILAGAPTPPLEPLYLRRPDAKTLAERGK